MKHAPLLLLLGVLLIAAGSGWYLMQRPANSTTPQVNTQPLGEAAVTIVRTAEGYEPKEVTIQKGDIVSFVNQTDEFHWPASDLHPTHGVYPEFDPLEPIGPGQEWKFQFDQTGEWKYHDHIRANKTGTIIVN